MYDNAKFIYNVNGNENERINDVEILNFFTKALVYCSITSFGGLLSLKKLKNKNIFLSFYYQQRITF